MENDALQLQIQLLEQMIDFEEANYKEAISLQKDYNTLRKMRENTSQDERKYKRLETTACSA